VALQTWASLAGGVASTTDGTPLASSASIATISPNATTNPPLTIRAGALFRGAVLRVTAAGRHSTTGTPTLTFGLFANGSGGTLLASSAALTCSNNAANLAYFIDVLVRCDTIGSSGALIVEGSVTLGGVGAFSIPASSPAAVTVSTVAAMSLDLTATWSASSASNTITNHLWVVQGLNADVAG